MATKPGARGGRGSNQYATKGISSARPRHAATETREAVRQADVSPDEVAWTFAPDSPAAWEWAFPGQPDLAQRIRPRGYTAVTAFQRLRPFVDAGFTPSEATRFDQAEMTVADAVDWKDHDRNVLEAVQLHSNGFTRREAEAWNRAGFSNSQAIKWRKSGATVNEAGIYSQRWGDFPGIPRDLKAAGLDPLAVIAAHEKSSWRELPDVDEEQNSDPAAVAAAFQGAHVPLGHTAARLVSSGVPLTDTFAVTINPGGSYPLASSMTRGDWHLVFESLDSAGFDKEAVFTALLDVNPPAAIRAAAPLNHCDVAAILHGDPAPEEDLDRASRWALRWVQSPDSSVQYERPSTENPAPHPFDVIARLQREGWDQGPVRLTFVNVQVAQRMYPQYAFDVWAKQIAEDDRQFRNLLDEQARRT